MRFATYNIEWMSALFHGGLLRRDSGWSARFNVTRQDQADAISSVIKEINADLYLILEAPNDSEHTGTQALLKRFSKYYKLRQNRALLGYSNHTEQEIALLYDPKIIEVHYAPQKRHDLPRFEEDFYWEGLRYRFSKPPLEAVIRHKPSNKSFRFIGVHLKTKAPHKAKTQAEVLSESVTNRLKQQAQAKILRKHVEYYDLEKPLLMAGDFNDSLGFDDVERELGESALDILLENDVLYSPESKNPTANTARFELRDERVIMAQLDHIFVNNLLKPYARNWVVYNPIDNEEIKQDQEFTKALLQASDHFPVSVDLDF